MSKSSKLVFFGNERLASGLGPIKPRTLESLLDNGYEVSAVVSHYTEGRSRKARPLEIAEVAKKCNIPLLLPDNLSAIKEKLQSIGAEEAVLVAYGKIIPKEIIDIFPRGIINIHPSLLPKYRGPTPIEQAILDGAKETGTSIMRLVKEMDAGPIYAQSKIALSSTESKAELANTLLKMGADLLIKNLDSILSGTLKPKPQAGFEEPEDESKMVLSYTELIKKTDGRVDFDNMLATYIERKVRAYAGWPKSRATVLGQDIVITKARVAKDEKDGYLVIKCMVGWLEIQELTAPSGRSITGAEFLRGYTKR